MVALGNAVELGAAVGDDAGEDVEAAGRALGIGQRRDPLLEGDAFQQRDDVDAVPFQHRTLGQVERVHGDPLQPFGDGGVGAGEEAGDDPIGLGA